VNRATNYRIHSTFVRHIVVVLPHLKVMIAGPFKMPFCFVSVALFSCGATPAVQFVALIAHGHAF